VTLVGESVCDSKAGNKVWIIYEEGYVCRISGEEWQRGKMLSADGESEMREILLSKEEFY